MSIVTHNLIAMNANRQLNMTNKYYTKTSEKLSSGFKINRAADDAAGLTISEKMRKQINGLERASLNAEDGVSLVQTAEGALVEVHNILQRMNELAVQASNGTNSEDDRQSIQNEIEQLLTETNRISETTKFNETYLLKGASPNIIKALAPLDAKLDGFFQLNPDGSYAITSLGGHNFYTFDISHMNLNNGNHITIEGRTYTIVDPSTYTYTSQLDRLNLPEAQAAFSKGEIQPKHAVDLMGQALFEVNRIGADNYTETYRFNYEVVYNGRGFYVAVPLVQSKEPLSINLQVGADSSLTNKISVDIAPMDSASLGLNNLELKDKTGEKARYAIYAITNAIETVSKQRSALGATQNRLEHTISNLDNVAENTTAAESRIRDTDMAEEMIKFSKENILLQAGQAILAQANKNTEGVLNLLK